MSQHDQTKKRRVRITEKKKKKSSGKKDACYHKVKARYDVWPSAYASGALVKCRKVGAANWGNKSKKNEEFIPGGESSKFGQITVDEMIQGIAEEHGVSEEQIRTQFEMGVEEEMEHADEELIAQEIALDHLVEDPEYYSKLEAAQLEEAKRKKAGTESSKESNLGDWFKRKGAKGSKGGWVDCNAPDGKGGYKSCGRSSGEKRKKYPACRPTPGACKERGKGKSWGKKAKKRKKNESMDKTTMKIKILKESKQKRREKLFQPGLLEHVKTKTPLHENIYRVGSECYFNTIRQGRKFYKMGLYEAINEEEKDMLENTQLGEWAMFEGEKVPLDFPMYIETLDEKKKKKKKNPPIGKPMKNTGGGKKYQVYVRNPKTGNVKKITYGDSKGGLKGNWNNAEARKSFAARHNCADKKDRTKSGYWACRAHKDFGTNVPGRFW